MRTRSTAVRDPDWDEFQRFQDAAEGRIVLMTLAPERPGAIDFIRRRWPRAWSIALGHTAADGATLRAAVAAGARLSTHLGNGIAATLPRHPNPIWDQAALDYLSASFIADGHHLDRVDAPRPGPRQGRPSASSWSATPARSPACRRAVTATGPSIPRARSSWPAPPTSPARTRGSRSA